MMDRNFDDKLSYSEMKNTDPKIFNLLDSDSDGYVTMSELQHLMGVLQDKHDSLVGGNADYF